jgi:hypothetical protein
LLDAAAALISSFPAWLPPLLLRFLSSMRHWGDIRMNSLISLNPSPDQEGAGSYSFWQALANTYMPAEFLYKIFILETGEASKTSGVWFMECILLII